MKYFSHNRKALRIVFAISLGLFLVMMQTVLGVGVSLPSSIKNEAGNVSIIKQESETGSAVNNTDGFDTLEQEEYVPMGSGKKEQFIRIAQNAFGLDVDTFDYISEGELLDMSDTNTLPEKYYPILAIRNVIYIGLHEGDHIPLGYLWKDNEIVTVAEQSDGSVSLLQYHTIPGSQLKSSDDLLVGCAYDDSPVYFIERIESKIVDQTLLNDLYFGH